MCLGLEMMCSFLSNGHDASKDLKKTCFNCGEKGHINKFCPKPVVSISQHESSAARKMVTEVNIALGTYVLGGLFSFLTFFGLLFLLCTVDKGPDGLSAQGAILYRRCLRIFAESYLLASPLPSPTFLSMLYPCNPPHFTNHFA